MFFIKEHQKNPTVQALSKNRKLSGFNDLLGFALMVDSKTLMHKDGAFSAYFIYRGPDVDSSTGTYLDAVVASLNQALRYTQDGWMLEMNLVSLEATDYPAPQDFPDIVSAMIDDERRAQYESEDSHFDTLTYLTLTWTPDRELSARIKKFAIETDSEVKAMTLDEIHAKFENQLTEITGVLSAFLKLERIEGQDLLTFLHYCITGKSQTLKVPPSTFYLDCYLATEDFTGGFRPKIGNQFIRTLTFYEFPTESFPTILDRLNSFPVTYRWSKRFISLSPSTAEKYLKSYQRSWSSKALGFMGLIQKSVGSGGAVRMNRDAENMLEEVLQAKSDNENGLIRFGFTSSTIVLMSSDENKLTEIVKDMKSEIQQLGFTLKDEDVNAVEAYLGSIPGHGYYNLRRPLMDSVTFAQMSPISSIYQGEKICPCPMYAKKSPPLFYSATNGSRPYRFNLHIKDVGHTMIVGMTGAGKTTLLSLIAAQHRKYPGSRVIFFDKDNSNKAITWALNGEYYDPGENESISFGPLAHIHEDDELDWACTFIEEICELNGIKPNQIQKSSIREALEGLAQSELQHRTLKNLVLSVQEVGVRKVLENFISSQSISRLLGGYQDSIENADVMALEMGWLLQQKEAHYVPVISYLIRKLEKMFKDIRPTLLILEEAWLYLDNPIFARKIKDWLKTLRKRNVSAIITTQSMTDILKSSISEVLSESCPTKIYLPNPNIKEDSIRKVYESLGLNDRQIQIIASSIPKRHYYVTSILGNRLIDLGLGDLAIAFLGISDDEKKYFYATYRKGDKTWIRDWLVHKNLGHWVEHFDRHYGGDV